MKHGPFAQWAIVALILSASPLASEPRMISDIVVIGVPTAESAVIRALLPFSEGDLLPSIGRARRLASFAQAYLGQDEHFSSVDITIEEPEAGLVDLYVFARPASISGLRVFENNMLTVPNFPLYGIGSGISIGSYEQFLGLDLPLSRSLAIDLSGGLSFSPDRDAALSGKAGLSFKPLPLISTYALGGVDAYLGAPGPVDSYVQSGARLDLGFLSRLTLFGALMEASYRRAFLGYSYEAVRPRVALGFQPLDFFKTVAMVELYSVAGLAPALAEPRNSGTRDLRIRGLNLPDSRGVAVTSLTASFALPFTARLGVASVSPSLFFFLEAAESYDRLAETVNSPLDAASSSFGGGLVLAISPPISLNLEIGLGYTPRQHALSFIARLPKGFFELGPGRARAVDQDGSSEF